MKTKSVGTFLLKWLGQNDRQLVGGLLLGGLLVRGAIALVLPPGFDEAYYYLYTRHLDWSYFDHPMMVALSTGLGPWLTGHVSQFTIRLGPLLLHTGALLLLYLTSCRLFSARSARLTLTIASIIPIFLVAFGVLTLPDAPLIFFWTATLYTATCEFFPPENRPYVPTYRLALLGLFVGLACLSKYHGAALGFGLIGFCLTTPSLRRVFRSPWLLVSLALFLVAIVPILIWNMQHDWVSLRFQSGRAIPDRGYSLLDLLVTFLAGVAYLFPTLGFPLWWVTGRQMIASKSKFSKAPDSYLPAPHALILWMALPLMFGFTLMGGYRPILPTWAAPGFWSATLLLGERAAYWQTTLLRRVNRWLWGSGLAIATLLLIATLHVSLGALQKPSHYAWFGGFLSPQADASVQLLDVQQLRQGFAHSPTLKTALATTGFLFTDNIYLAGQVGMAIAPLTQTPVTVLEEDLRGFAFWSKPDQWVGQDGLFIAVNWQQLPNPSRYQPYFETVELLADIPIKRGGAIVQMVHVYHCHKLLKPYPRPFGGVSQGAG